MQITFDPLNPAEAAAVAKMLGFGPLAIAAAESQMKAPRVEMTREQDLGNAQPAPSTAAADPSQIAPEVLQGFSAAPTSAAPAASAPTPPAPSAPVAPVSPAADGERDIHGLPWDARIHSSGENRKNADGSWRARRGTDPEVKATVEAELRAAAGGGAPLAAACGVASGTPVGPNSAPTQDAQPAAPVVPAASIPAPPIPAATAGAQDIAEPAAAGVLTPGADGVYDATSTAGVPPIPPVPPVPASSPPPIAPTPSAPPVPAAPTAPAPSAGATGEAKLWQVHDVIAYVNDMVNVTRTVPNVDLDNSLKAVGYGAGQFAMLFGAPADKLQAFMADFQARVAAAQQ